MGGFFNGIVLVLYMASHYLAEPIFLVALGFSSVYPILVMLFLQCGGCGRVIAAKRKTRRFLQGGVISGEMRKMYYDKCIKRSPAALRVAYEGFLRGEVSAPAFAERVIASLRDRRKLFSGLYYGVAASFSLLVFLVFYFTSAFSETVLRAVISAFVALSNGTVLRLLLYGYASSAKKAAVRLSEMLDGRLLREKSAPIVDEPKYERSDREETDRLRLLLREVEESFRG